MIHLISDEPPLANLHPVQAGTRRKFGLKRAYTHAERSRLASHVKWLWTKEHRSIAFIEGRLDLPYEFVRRVVAGDSWTEVEAIQPPEATA